MVLNETCSPKKRECERLSAPLHIQGGTHQSAESRSGKCLYLGRDRHRLLGRQGSWCGPVGSHCIADLPHHRHARLFHQRLLQASFSPSKGRNDLWVSFFVLDFQSCMRIARLLHQMEGACFHSCELPSLPPIDACLKACCTAVTALIGKAAQTPTPPPGVN